jgi:myo-inositol-1(or 4)-monophosphatase
MASAFINIAIKAAYLAGNFIQQGSRSVSKIKFEKKGHNDYVTELDIQSEQIITRTILQAFPEHNILGEESGNLNHNSEYTWIIDPIDGTTNFIHGYPHYCISIALKKHNKIIVGVVFNPSNNDLFKAEAGSGAYLNDRRIRVTNNLLEHAIIGTGMGSDLSILDQYIATFKELSLKTSAQRRSGSAALDLAYVACGYTDGFWEYNLKAWDIAAGSLLVKEAGGIINDFNGNPHLGEAGNIIASNAKIAQALQKIISSHYQASLTNNK